MRRDARENRERILAAAEEVFGTQGEAGSTEEVARLAGVGIATVFRHFPTKDDLLGATLVRHFDHLTERANALAAEDPASAWRTLVRELITTGATKLTLGSALRQVPDDAFTASRRLKSVVRDVLRQAQEVGAVRASVTVEEVYLLIRGLAQATAAQPTEQETLDSAIDVVLAGLST
ncbi:TetR/AcrR family transcriptional regulator [Kibdelosporangium lantanae]